MNERDFWRLLEAAGSHLAGRPVAIREAQPPYQGALGAAIRNHDGSAVVFVTPNVDVETWWKVFLHEVAHIRLHFADIPASNDAMRAPGSILKSTSVRLGVILARDIEGEADKLAYTWLKYAERHCLDFPEYSGTRRERELRALLRWEL